VIIILRYLFPIRQALIEGRGQPARSSSHALDKRETANRSAEYSSTHAKGFSNHWECDITKMRMKVTHVMPSPALPSAATDEAGEEMAGARPATVDAVAAQPRGSTLDEVVREAWRELLRWVQDKKFKPESEEDIQCFLYYAMLKRLNDATLIKSKPTTDKIKKAILGGGKADFGDMHFPDFIVGANRDVVIEIKFNRSPSKGDCFAGCRSDLEKLKKYHSKSKRFLVIYDMSEVRIFLSDRQLGELQNAAGDCELLYHPMTTTNSVGKQTAAKAWETLRAKGYDPKTAGERGAAKAYAKKRKSG